MGESIGLNISNCYNFGTIKSSYAGHALAGGIVGWIHPGTVSNSYSYGSISATGAYNRKYACGVVGWNGHTSATIGTITNCYCSNVTYSHINFNTVITNGVEDEDMLKTYATVLGDSFTEDEKNINNGYPILKWQLKK